MPTIKKPRKPAPSQRLLSPESAHDIRPRMRRYKRTPASPIWLSLSRLAKRLPDSAAFAFALTNDVTRARQEYLDQISHVKTLWQVDKAVPVEEFYFPTRVELADMPRRIDTYDSLAGNGPTVIEGIAGQGKSIFLRHLAASERKPQRRLPIFVQLRFINDSTTLEALVDSVLTSILGSADKRLIEYLLRNSRLLFLLDGFDEIPQQLRTRTIREISKFVETRRQLPLIITARPNSDIQQSSLLNVAPIKQLDHQDRALLIDHLVDDQETFRTILTELKGRTNISDILITPLLVTLLVITYKADSDIPENLSDFYKSIFSTLFRRHDKSKPGYFRERRTQLSNVEFERVFENLCFLSMNDQKLNFSQAELEDVGRAALDMQYHELTRSEDYVDDLVRITCLIIQDGDQFHYLHKSIPEYFTAQKVAQERIAENKSHFYSRLRAGPVPENWYQVLRFLSEIDEANYVDDLLLPSVRRLFNLQLDALLPPLLPAISRDTLASMIGKSAELVGQQNLVTGKYVFRIIAKTDDWFFLTYFHAALERSITAFLANGGASAAHDHAKKHSRNFFDCIEATMSWPSAISHLNSCPELRARYAQLLQQVKRTALVRERSRPLFKIPLTRN